MIVKYLKPMFWVYVISNDGNIGGNYVIFLTRDCQAYFKIKPAVNQIETHPYFNCESLVEFRQKHGICVTAHTPLGGSVANTELFGSLSCLDVPVLQRNTVAIPRTSKSDRQEENLKIFDFELRREDMYLINSRDRNYGTNQPAKYWGIDV
ncbi:hypothetical protein Ancab_018019 [Ancistrocladus abbreviatus]